MSIELKPSATDKLRKVYKDQKYQGLVVMYSEGIIYNSRGKTHKLKSQDINEELIEELKGIIK